MIQIIYGAKGSGKTKKIIDLANEIAGEQKEAVFIAGTNRYMYDIKRNVRFVNAIEAGIETTAGLLGMVRGLIAGNSDIEMIFIDNASKITAADIADMEDFYEDLLKISDLSCVNFVITVSMNKDELPQFIRKFI